MEKHPHITLERIRLFIAELHDHLWIDQQPLQVSVFQCPDPLPYAEAIAQRYTPVALPFPWGPQWSSAWFHLQGAFPDAWAGSTVAVLVDTGSEALIWQQGAPAQGLDCNRQDFILEEAATCGGEIDLYIEAAANGLAGALDVAEFSLTTAAVARLNRPAWDLYHDARILFNLLEHLPEGANRRAQLLHALNEAVNAYRRDGCAAARAVLAPALAQPAAASAMAVTAIGHSHIDVAWLWPLRETIRKTSRTFSTVLTYMARYPEYRFTQSQPQLYAYVKEHYPALYTRIKQAVADGRWEPQGAMWVEADCNVISGESMIRQILHGTRFFHDEFGVENTILWLPDVFGYSAALPQILRGCGIPYFLTQKISWNQINSFPHHTFWWEGIDGSKVLAHFLPANTYNGQMLPRELLFGESNFKDRGRSNTWLHLYGFGDGGGGVTQEMLEAARRMRNLDGLPTLQPGFARDWFPRMAAKAHDLRTWSGELYLEYHRGTYTTQAKNKWENRRCEFLLRDAECLAALHPEDGSAYPADELDRAWKLVLLNQFHDIIPGSSIARVYEDSQRDYAVVRTIGDRIVADALEAFAGKIDTMNCANPLLIWNTLSFQRSGLVSIPWQRDEDMRGVTPRNQAARTQATEENGECRLLVEVVDVPAVGYVTYDLVFGRMPGEVTPLVTDVAHARGRVLENDLVRLTLNECGEVASFIDKGIERELVADGGVGNLFQRFDDRPNAYDAWDIDPFYDEVGEDLHTPATVTVVEDGPVRATLRVDRALTPRARMVQLIRLEANSRRIDFETTIDWQEEHALLKVAFPLAIYSARATYEIQYGHVERPTHRNTSWDVARFEVCAHKWADLSESDFGVALLNDGKYGYDVHGNVMRLTLLRAPKSPDPQADMGTHRFTYSLLPHRGDVGNSGVPLAGYDLNVPFLTHRLPVQEGILAQTHSYFRLDRHNLIIEAVKRAEDGDGLIVRLYEAYRRRGVARLILNGLCTRATRTDLLERNLEDLPVEGGAVQFAFRPFEIITLRLR